MHPIGENELYVRQILLNELGHSGQEKLKRSSVLVIGAGGLGCPVLQYLNAAGIGKLGIVDFDVVVKSNLHRQILYAYDSIGKKKASAAKKRLLESNPFTSIEVFETALKPDNAIELINNYDIVVDCTDNYQTRYIINDACLHLNKPLVYGAIYKFEGQITVFNYENGPSYRCLFPKVPERGSDTNCSESGVLGVLPAIIGTMQATEVIKILIDTGDVLSGVLLNYNGLSSTITKFKFEKSSHEINLQIKEEDQLNPENYSQECFEVHESADEIDFEMFKKMLYNQDVQFIDVRNKNELPKFETPSILNIPLNQLSERVGEIDFKKRTVLFCQSGKRSREAIRILKEKHGYDSLTNLSDGILPYVEELKTLNE